MKHSTYIPISNTPIGRMLDRPEQWSDLGEYCILVLLIITSAIWTEIFFSYIFF